MASLFVFAVFRILFPIVRNLIKGFEFRRDLGKKIGDLRLSKMLRSLDIALPAYLHKNRVVDIEAHMRACQACETQQTCDEELGGVQKPEDYSFCPNYPALEAAARMPASASAQASSTPPNP
jgi:hypothetical protein